MTRQKLPEGICGPCEYVDAQNRVTEDDDTEVYSFMANGRACIHIDECACYVSTALAVIRNAGLDAVYAKAKEIVALYESDGLTSEIITLKKLIESLEEP